MRACLYARYSTDMQSKESIADQLRVCARLAQRFGFDVVGQFSDAAISGGTTQRPGYQDMLRAARHHEFEVILAEDSSRLWRNLAEQSPRLAELSDLGIHIVTHDLDTRAESAGIMGAVTGAMGEQYRKEIGRRTRRGLEGLARNKKPTGGKSYGYISAAESKSKEREIEPAQAKVVLEIFEMAAQGLSARRIANELNARRVPSPGATWKRSTRRSDSKWLASAIQGDVRKDSGILNNPVYRGTVVWNRVKWVRSATDSSKRRQVPNPRSEWIKHQDERLRIVGDDLWERVKSRQLARAHTIKLQVSTGQRRRPVGGGKPPRYLLSDILRCGPCGAGFTMVNAERYGCASHKGGGDAACSNALTVSRALAESRIKTAVLDDLRDPKNAADIFADMEVSTRQQLKAAMRAPKVSTDSEIKRLRKEIDNLVNAIATGMLKASPALADKLSATEEQHARLLAESARQKQQAGANVVPLSASRVAENFLKVADRLEGLMEKVDKDPERARAALRDVVGNNGICLYPHESGRHLMAAYDRDSIALLAVGNSSLTVVAGVGFEPTTFGL